MLAEILITFTLFVVIASILWFLIGKRLVKIFTELENSPEDESLNSKIQRLQHEKTKLEKLRGEIEITSLMTDVEKEINQLEEKLRLLNIKAKVRSQGKKET
ncbi:MAG: hypothetical protein GY749_31295 [Desulfobacteraceae bacterium]|nr:hypothetical protein [Desulfobacteraceae bacterium]